MKVSIFPLSTLHANGASCSLLYIEDPREPSKKLTIMLDCGLSQRMDISRLRHYQKKISKTNIILISQGATEYSAGLPIILNSRMVSSKTPIFATSPVADYAYRNFVDQFMLYQQQFLKDPSIEENKQADEFRKVVQNAEDTYRKITRLNIGHKQYLSLIDNLFNVTICPVRAGYTIGASAWRIRINMMNIIIISEHSMIRELHIDPLAVDKLITPSSSTGNSLQRSKLDLLVVNTPAIQKDLPKQTFGSVKQAIKDLLSHIMQPNQQNSTLLLSFYPNERVIEGILAIDSILHEFQELKGIRCDLLVNYSDIIEKAGGQTDFLSHTLLNWRRQEQTHQTPLDPNYLKQKFLNIYNSVKQIQMPTSKIIMTTHNNLFYGPFSKFLQQYLYIPQNFLVMFGQPTQPINFTIKTGFRGPVDCQLREQDSITFNAIKKILMKKSKEITTTTAEASESHGEGIMSTTARSGTYDTISQMSQEKSLGKMTEDSSDPFDFPDEPSQQQEQSMDIQEKQSQIYSDNESPISEQIINQPTQQISVFEFPQWFNNNPNPLFINCQVFLQTHNVSSKDFNILCRQLQPSYVSFLHPTTKAKQFDDLECKISSNSNCQTYEIMRTLNHEKIPFLQVDDQQIKGNILRVQLKVSYKGFKGINTTDYQCSVIRHPQQIQYNVMKEKQTPPLLKLLKHLQDKQINCLLGLGQIQVENGQIIITKTSNGYSLHGTFGKLYVQIRQMLQSF